MGPHKIDLSDYPRKEHFAHFLTMTQPFLTMTVKVDITGFLERVRQEEALVSEHLEEELKQVPEHL